ncbi:MAG TPA: response regulator transcription factor [Gemmataceae bacterium]|jgi:DNA-binding NarL/FixJ family response regulator
MPITVLLADDHAVVREGLRAILGAERDVKLVGEAADGQEALRQAERLKPDVLVLDLLLPGLNGFEVTRQMRRRSPRTRVVVLSIHADPAYVAEAVRAGATGYVAKDAQAVELLAAVRAAAAGERYLGPPLPEAALAGGEPADPYDSLTPREREVLQLTAEGFTGAQIAEKLFISRRTVETHRAHVMHKLGLRNQKEVVRYALQRQPPPPPAAPLSGENE